MVAQQRSHDDRLNDLEKYMTEAAKQERGVARWVERNLAPLLTIGVLAVGLVANYVRTSVEQAQLDARVTRIEQTYVPRSEHEVKDQMRAEEWNAMNTRLDRMDTKLDRLLNTNNSK